MVLVVESRPMPTGGSQDGSLSWVSSNSAGACLSLLNPTFSCITWSYQPTSGAGHRHFGIVISLGDDGGTTYLPTWLLVCALWRSAEAGGGF